MKSGHFFAVILCLAVAFQASFAQHNHRGPQCEEPAPDGYQQWLWPYYDVYLLRPYPVWHQNLQLETISRPGMTRSVRSAEVLDNIKDEKDKLKEKLSTLKDEDEKNTKDESNTKTTEATPVTEKPKEEAAPVQPESATQEKPVPAVSRPPQEAPPQPQPQPQPPRQPRGNYCGGDSQHHGGHGGRGHYGYGGRNGFWGHNGFGGPGH